MKRMILLLLVLLLVFTAGCTQSPSNATATVPDLKEPADVASGTTAAYIGPMYRLNVYMGSITPYVEDLSMEIDGYVSEYYAYPGKWVEEGEILLELNTESIQKEIDQLETSLAETEKGYAYSDRLVQLEIQMLEVELRRLQDLQADQKAIDLKKNDIAQRKADLRQDQKMRELDLNKTRQTIAELKEKREKTVLRAPFSGRIIRGNLYKGHSVKADVPFLYIADDTRLSLTCQYISDAMLESADQLFARIGEIDYEIQVQPLDLEEYYAMTAAGEIPIRHFDVVGPQDALANVEAGQYAAVCVITDYVEDALIVPTESVFTENDKTYVYVNENGAKTLREVSVGVSMRGMTQILEGLEEGEEVYVAE